MRKLDRLLLVVAMAGGFLYSTGKNRVVDNPVVTAASTTTIDVMNVELTDSATVLHMEARFRPHWWIKIVPETYLLADGKHYSLKSAEGFVPGEEFYMPDSGCADFVLTFEPLPADTESFDLIEGDDDGAFKLWGVDLTGKPLEIYPAGLPAKLRNDVVDGPLPAVDFGIGKTTVNLTLLNFKKGMANEMSVYITTMAGGQDEVPLKFDSEGKASFSFDQCGVAKLFLAEERMSYGDFWVSPGETVDVYIDMRISGNRVMRGRKNGNEQRLRSVYVDGKYGDLSAINDLYPRKYLFQLYTGEFADYKMTGEEYFDMVMNEYHALSDSISAAGYPQMAKEFAMVSLNNDALTAIADYKYLMEHNYRAVNDYWNYNDPFPVDSIKAELGDKQYLAFAKEICPADERLLLTMNVSRDAGAVDWAKYGVKGDLPKSISLYKEIAYNAAKNNLKQADRDTLRTLSNPFYGVACDSLQVWAERENERMAKMKLVQPTPDVAVDEVFDAIVAPHRGKVVLVDLWNTWCGPCRAAIKHNEPLKDGELKSDDLVWIYIADESSQLAKYVSMLPDIRGLHYKVTEDQMVAMRNRFGVDGIPYYILVERDGKATGHPDFRNPETLKSGIKEALGR